MSKPSTRKRAAYFGVILILVLAVMIGGLRILESTVLRRGSGIQVDHVSKTSMEQLYAVGETACNGVHGKNRLASNSLLESLVFAKRAAKEICKELDSVKTNTDAVEQVALDSYPAKKELAMAYRDMVLNEIQRFRNEEVR